MENQNDAFMRIKHVLEVITVSRSTWLNGVRDGRYPKPIKLSPRTTAWKRSDILALVRKLSGEKE